MSRRARMIVAGCAAAVAIVLTAGTTASADSDLGTDGTRVTGQHDNKESGTDTRELGLDPDTRELGPDCGLDYPGSVCNGD